MNYNRNNNLAKQFELLKSIVSEKSPGNKLIVDLGKIEYIIDKQIPEALRNNAPDDFFNLYSDFKSEYDKFRDFIIYDKLIGKNVVALGGGFSSGKSSFINKILGKAILPNSVDPCTSIPTYIVKNYKEKYETMGLNIFDTKVKMNPIDIRLIAHGFGELRDDDENIIMEPITLGHLMKNMFFSTELMPYENIAFSDTPGYSKPDTKEYSSKTDEHIARLQLNSSNYILWFVQANAGTITEEDIKFIKTLREDIPKLIIVSKSDNKNLSDLKDIILKIKTNLELKGIRYIDVFAFSDRCCEDDKELYEFIEENIEKIKEQISSWDSKKYKSNFAINFKKLFVRCKSYYEDNINEESRKLNRLNTSITKISAEDVEYEIIEPLQSLAKDTQESIKAYKERLKKIKELQDEFFMEIKYISDKVGIEMPEPSEIDLLKDTVVNPMEVLEKYKKEHGIKTDKKIVKLMEESFKDVKPVINRCAGGSEYKEEIVNMLMNNLDIKKEDIKIMPKISIESFK